MIINDYKLINHRFNSDITIYAISDLHLGCAECNRSEWESFIKNIEADPNAYVILVGDLMNNATRSSVSNVFEDVLRPAEQKDILIENLKPIKGRILCGVPGNHERRSGKDADNDPMFDVMKALGIEHLYRKDVAYMKICIGKRNKIYYTFAVTHGCGTGINRGENFGYTIENLDCLITGHTHKGNISKPAKVYIDSKDNSVYVKEFTYLTCQSWLKYSGYAAQKMLRPAATASVKTSQKILLHKNEKLLNIIW